MEGTPMLKVKSAALAKAVEFSENALIEKFKGN
jgi:hypothetical protein